MAKDKPEPTGRAVKIKQRVATFTNYNQKPEKHGDKLAPAADLSIAFTLADSDVAEALAVDGGADALWNEKGECRIAEIGGAIPLNLAAAGDARISPMRGKGVNFTDAKLKKVSVELLPDRKVQVFAQLRIDPSGGCEMLLQLQCARGLKFAFDGHALVTPEPPPSDETQEEPQLPLEE